MDDAERITRLCRALGVETRVRIVEQLRRGPLCVGALAARLNLSQSAISQHLRVLRDAGLVLPDRQGYFTHYRLNDAEIADYLQVAGRVLLDRDEETGTGTGKEQGESSCVP